MARHLTGNMAQSVWRGCGWRAALRTRRTCLLYTLRLDFEAPVHFDLANNGIPPSLSKLHFLVGQDKDAAESTASLSCTNLSCCRLPFFMTSQELGCPLNVTFFCSLLRFEICSNVNDFELFYSNSSSSLPSSMFSNSIHSLSSKLNWTN